MSALDRTVSFWDFRDRAKARLPRLLFDYIDSGSYSETTLARNREAFRNRPLGQRIMVDMASVDSRVQLFGQDLAVPLVLAPVGFAGMYARRGEVQAARAAAAAGIPFALSTLGICSIEEVTAGAGTAPWFQLYITRDRGWLGDVLQRAHQAGCPVLVLTADLQVPATRYRDVRSGFARPPGVADWIRRSGEGISRFGWTWDVFLRGRPHTFGNLEGALSPKHSFHEAWAWTHENFDPSVNWSDIDFIRRHWNRPIVIKGVMNTADARRAADQGINGIVVSNHGGRQLDGERATLEALPDIVDAVGDRMTVLLDSGVTSGLDILRAIQAGARGVLAGRAWAFALAAFGEAGVSQLISLWANELRTGQVLTATHRLSRE